MVFSHLWETSYGFASVLVYLCVPISPLIRILITLNSDALKCPYFNLIIYEDSYFFFFFVFSISTLSCVWLFVTPWTIAFQVPLSMGFPRQGYWSGLSFPSPGDLPGSGSESASPVSPAMAGRLYNCATWWSHTMTLFPHKVTWMGTGG